MITLAVAVRFLCTNGSPLSSLCFIGGLINDRDQLIQNTRRLLVKAMKISANKFIKDYTVTVKGQNRSGAEQIRGRTASERCEAMLKYSRI